MRIKFPRFFRRVAFLGLWVGVASAGIAADFGATYKLVAFTGEPAPGGGTYQYFDVPRIGASGVIGFIGWDYAGESTSYHVYAGRSGALKRIVSTGDAAPGAKDATFSDFWSLSVSKDGGVGFNAGVSSDGYSSGLYYARPAGPVTAVVPSDSLSLISLGDAAFRSGTIFAKGVYYSSEPGAEQRTFQTMFRGIDGVLTPALTDGTVVDGRLVQEISGGTEGENSIGSSVDVNESGQIAIKVAVAPSASPTPYPLEAILAGSPAKPSLVAQQSDAVPGLADAEFIHFSSQPSIAATGQIAFSAIFSAGESSRSGIFSGRPGAITAKALENAAVPTTTDVTFGSLSDAVINATGDVVFRATIVYPNGGTRSGLWIKRQSQPSPVLLAVDGMTLPTPSGPQEVTSVDFAGPGTFNDLHQVVFLAQFGDSEGIYVADTRPVAPWLRAIFPRKPRDRVTRAKSITISGAAVDDTGIAGVKYTVAVPVKNGKSRDVFKNRIVRKARGNERWSFIVPLALGVNRVTIIATDKLGNVSEPLILTIRRY